MASLNFTDEEVNNILNSPQNSSTKDRLELYGENKIALLDAYLKGSITADLFIRLAYNLHGISLDEKYIKDWLNNHYMMEYIVDVHETSLSHVENQFRKLLKEIAISVILNNPWELFSVKQAVNDHFSDNTYVKKFYRKNYTKDNFIQIINQEILTFNPSIPEEQEKIDGLEELKDILEIVADMEVSDSPGDEWEDLQNILNP